MIQDLNFIAIDFETATGKRASICEVGICVVRNGKIVETRSWLVRPPGNYYSYWNMQLHGIGPSDTVNALEFPEIWSKIAKYLKKYPVIVAHNAAFDISCIRHSLELYGLEKPEITYYCSLQIARCLYDFGCNTLDYLCDQFEIPYETHHRAEGDAKMCAQLFLREMQDTRWEKMVNCSGKLYMDDNLITLRSIEELLGTKFFIPKYQRGYRWNEQQVTDLLNDVYEFRPTTNNNFYCLQPLVVKKKKNDISNKIKVEQLFKGEWEVIDGQQRLTTIFIILSCLKKTHLYSLEYETRAGSTRFLKNIDNSQRGKNIDYYHICKAKETVKNWLESVPTNTVSFAETLLSKVKFIWYESVDEDSIQVFTRLNIGKISLTNAELIKALFLNRSNFSGEGSKYMHLCQQEIASEWDDIEYTLQNDEFWLFLHEKNYKRPTRIDFIFELICQQNTLQLTSEQINTVGTDDYKTFRYFYTYFQSESPDVTSCWKHVKTYYQIFQEWYHDLKLYHYVGYLIACQQSTISDLIETWNSKKDKSAFVQYLQSKIKEKIGKIDLDYQYKEDGSDKRKCYPTLLFHNIQTVINQNHVQLIKYQLGTFYKFPFHLYKLEKWDVEHINPNTINKEDKIKTKQEWLLNVYHSVDKTMQDEIENSFKEFKTRNRKESDTDFNEIIDKIKKKLPDQKKWSQEDINKIWNYTLLDASTNRSYGNAIFPEKRRRIIGKEKGKFVPPPELDSNGQLKIFSEQDADSSFVPPCTKQVFLKYYSPVGTHNNYWTKADADAYKKDIERCIKQIENGGTNHD